MFEGLWIWIKRLFFQLKFNISCLLNGLWNQIVYYPLRTIVLTIAVALSVKIIVQTAQANNLGFPDKLWGYFELLFFPMMLAVGIFLLERFQRKEEAAREERQQLSEKKQRAEREEIAIANAEEQRKQATLSAYLDRITNVLMARTSASDIDLMLTVVRTATLQGLTALNNDKPKIQQVVDFLQDANLLQHESPMLGKGILYSANLKGRDLTKLSIEHIDLRKADLRETILAHANMSYANLSGAQVSLPLEEGGEEGNKPDWCNTTLKHATLEGLNLSRSNLSNADLSDAFCSNVDFRGALLVNTSMVRTDIRSVNFEDADLQGAKLQEAIIDEQTQWRNVDLHRANLTGTNLQQMNWQAVKIDPTTNLPDTKWFVICDIVNGAIVKDSLSRQDLSYARLVGVDLQNANLSGCNIVWTDLSGANLAYADLSKSDLRGAVLTNADLSFANMSGTRLDEEPKLDYKWRIVHALVNDSLDKLLTPQSLDREETLFKEIPLQVEAEEDTQLVSIDLSKAYLKYCNLRERKLTGANLSTSILERGDFTAADLAGANLEECDLTGAVLCKTNLKRARMKGCKLLNAQLEDADLEEADLTDAMVSDEQLKKAKSLNRTTLPSGVVNFRANYAGN